MMNALMLGIALTVAAPIPKDAPKTPAKLEGSWTIGEADATDDIKEKIGKDGAPTFTFEGGKVTITAPKGKGRTETADYNVDLTKKPATIDLKPQAGNKDLTIFGILELSGDKLKLCFARDGKPRPTEFKSDKEKEIQLIVLTRIKDK